jgi:hypothetical protein
MRALFEKENKVRFARAKTTMLKIDDKKCSFNPHSVVQFQRSDVMSASNGKPTLIIAAQDSAVAG